MPTLLAFLLSSNPCQPNDRFKSRAILAAFADKYAVSHCFSPATPISQSFAYATLKDFTQFWPILFETVFQFGALHDCQHDLAKVKLLPRFFSTTTQEVRRDNDHENLFFRAQTLVYLSNGCSSVIEPGICR
jgi:hypothetical protein